MFLLLILDEEDTHNATTGAHDSCNLFGLFKISPCVFDGGTQKRLFLKFEVKEVKIIMPQPLVICTPFGGHG